MEGVKNPKHHPDLDRRKKVLEDSLRSQFSSYDRKSLRALPVLAAYDAYYRRFGKTYHVQHQLESVALKGRSIPKVAALVEAMFMAELKNFMLTAGHDLDRVEGSLEIGAAAGTESYVRMNGEEQTLKPGDMMISDRSGIISCILYGPDQRTRIRASTERVVFTVYGPPGLENQHLLRHLEDLQENVVLVSSEAATVKKELVSATPDGKD